MNEQDNLPDEADLVPISLIAGEIGETVGWVAHHFGGEIVTDDIGLRSVPAAAARRFFTERREWQERHEENHRRRRAENERKYPKPQVPAVPAQEGLTAVETMMAAAGDWVGPDQEFGRPGQGGSVATDLLEQELAKGRRQAEEKRRQAAERKAGKQ